MTDITPTRDDTQLAADILSGARGFRVTISPEHIAAVAVAHHREAAIASVIAHATSDDAVERAARALMLHHDIDPDVFVGMHGGYGHWLDAARFTITAALTERQNNG